MDSISMCSNTVYMSNMDAGSCLMCGCQPQPWRNDIILTPQLTQNPKIWAKYGGYNCVRLLPYAYGCLWTAYWCAQTLCVCLIWMGEAVWDCCHPISLHKWPRTTKPPGVRSLCKDATACQWTAYQCTQTLLKCLRWMGGAVWDCFQPHHHVMTLFWHHKWPRTPKSESITENV